MNMQANMNKLVEQLTRVADALEKQNDLTVEFEERMHREQEADKEEMRQERKAREEWMRQQEAEAARRHWELEVEEDRVLQGLPTEPDDDDRLLH